MESIFNLEENERSSLLRQIIDSFGFTYVCLWSHFPQPTNCLIYIDGVYKDENDQASSSSSSSRSLVKKSFLDYQKSMFLIDNYSGGVPGFAFMHNLTYMELEGLELLGMASNSAQVQFYEEARIKKTIFMSCKNGEIELGMSNASSQKLFPGDFVISQLLDQARASSSSSSLRSLSMENSVEYSPFLSNMLQTSYKPEIFAFKEALLDLQAPNQLTPIDDPLQQALNQIRTTQMIPSREHEEAAMTRAILATISSSSSPPSSSSSYKLQSPRIYGAFKRYRSNIGPIKRVQSRQNLTKRSLSFFRNLSQARVQHGIMTQTTRPTSSQLHHMISERKRREKLNDSFQALRSLIPPGSKKDKASVLSNTKDYIASLKSQVEELNKRNSILEAAHLKKETLNQDSGGLILDDQRLMVGITDVGESTSESRVVDLEVNARGVSILSDLVTRMLEFMKQVEDVTVMSLDARMQMLETEAITNRIVLRLKIQGSEWDKSGFQEAMKMVLDDLAQ